MKCRLDSSRRVGKRTLFFFQRSLSSAILMLTSSSCVGWKACPWTTVGSESAKIGRPSLRDLRRPGRHLYLALLLVILFDVGLVLRARARDPFGDPYGWLAPSTLIFLAERAVETPGLISASAFHVLASKKGRPARSFVRSFVRSAFVPKRR